MASLDILLVLWKHLLQLAFVFSGQQAVKEEINLLVRFSK